MKYFYSFLLLIFIASCQSSVKFIDFSGTVKDATTNEPIEGAYIKVEDKQVISDKEGKFVITKIPQGGHILVITKDNYKTYNDTVYFSDTNLNKEFLLNKLQLTTYQVKDIIVKPSILTLSINQTKQLEGYILMNDNTKNTDIIWSVEDSKIAEVDKQGNVKGISVGNTVVFAKGKDSSKVGKCYITVKPINLALNKPIFASEYYKPSNNSPNYAVDDNENTMWCSGKGATKDTWLYIDFEKEVKINEIEILVESYTEALAKGILYSSLDKKDWKEIDKVTAEFSKNQTTKYEGIIKLSLSSPIVTKYLKFIPTEWGGWVSIKELRVY